MIESSPRSTLKLKCAPRQAASNVDSTATQVHNRVNQTPRAHESNPYLEQMQRDMDALALKPNATRFRAKTIADPSSAFGLPSMNARTLSLELPLNCRDIETVEGLIRA